ncbi:hypothetical protein B0H17DRAFT_1119642 [Mycena rosella]|uniref:NACHT domain-containing protein n=1 Tax=Mycena rosella TaxID=1033263 RepID=A0AAD7B025_MYCRO|nr:hypothetical protein B0H17DRAFT_1119642 [Mycena rosella]
MILQQSQSPGPIPSSPGFHDAFNNANPYIGEDGLYMLHSAIAVGASYDSIERYPPPRCHPQTRKVVFEIILAWTTNVLHGPRLLWVHGDPGSGKSAVSQTVAEYCAQSGQLGATFFFSHGRGDLSDGMLLFPTLAYKLAGAIPEIRAPLSRAIQNDSSILTQSLEVQVQKLIVEPFMAVPPPPMPILIVIDGLDACVGDEMQHRILMLLAQLIMVHRLPLCFFVTSRLHPYLQATFDTPILRKLSNRIPLDVFASDTDVRNFLRSEFTNIRHAHAHTMAGIPDPWPSEDVINLLVQKSGGHFLYPATVIKYVDDKSGLPAERLVEVVVSAASDSALSPTDQLYHHILSSGADPPALLRVLGPIVALYTPLPPKELEVLVGLGRGDVCTTLREMHALVDVPGPTASPPADTVRIPQPSVSEFLGDIHRSLQFWIETRIYHAELARGCIQYIGDYMDSADTLDLASYQYIRRRWLSHLEQAIPSPELFDDLRVLRFVYSRVPAEVRAVVAWLQKIPNAPHDLVHLWADWLAQLQTSRYVP